MCIIRPRSKDRVDILYVYYQAQVKGQGRYFICILTGPVQRIGHTTIETSRLKLEITQAFSISDTEFRQKTTTKMTSCNGWRKVRIGR